MTVETEISDQVVNLVIAVVLGCFGILVTGSFRAWIDSLVHLIVPVGEKQIGQGGYRVAYTFCEFILFASMIFLIGVVLAPFFRRH